MDMLLDERPDLKIDFFVMDEIYKIQDDEDRKSVFSNCLYRLSKMKTDFYLIGPYFDDFSPNFREKLNQFLKNLIPRLYKKTSIIYLTLQKAVLTLYAEKRLKN